MRRRNQEARTPTTVDYLVTENKCRLYAAVSSAAYALRNARVWDRDRKVVDVVPLCAELGNLVEQVAFFSPEPVNMALGRLVIASADFADEVKEIQKHSTAGFRGAVDMRFRENHENAFRVLDRAISEFVTVAREDLGITSIWSPVPRSSAAGDSGNAGT